MTHTERDAKSVTGMPLAGLALATGVLPFVTGQVSYVISASADLIPTCITYLTGCTSVSASGRHGLSYYLYKAGMLPSAVLLAAYWVLARQWLRTLGGGDSRAARVMVVLGVTSGLFYVMYAIFVGSIPFDLYVVLRRLGAGVHLVFAMFAQVLLTREILRLPEPARSLIPVGLRRAMVAFVTVLVALGVLSIPMDEIVTDKDSALNVIEWHFTTLMVGYYVLSWWAWKATGFRVAFGAGGVSARS